MRERFYHELLANPYLESGRKKYLLRDYRAGVASGYPDSVVCLLRSTRRTRRFWLKRLFSAYPGGLAGIGLVLLRSVIGFTAAWQGVLCLTTKDAGTTVRIVGGLTVLTGILLVTGFRTRPLACSSP